MKAVKFTDLAGNPIWIVDTWVQAIRKPQNGEYQANAHTVLVMSGYNQAILEDIDTTMKLFGLGNVT